MIIMQKSQRTFLHLSIFCNDLVDEKYQTKGQQLKFEYTKLWAKISFSAKPMKDLSLFRTFSCDAAFLQIFDICGSKFSL